MWPKAEMSKAAKNLRKINVFGRVLEATSLEKGFNVAFWRSSCGLEGLKTASWMTSWLQDGLERAKSSPRWPKMAPRWPQEGSKKYLAGFCRCLSPLFGPILGPSWAHLGLSWALLGPSRGVQEGTLRQILGLEGLILGCKVAERRDVKNRQKKHQWFLADVWRQRAFRKLAKWLSGGLAVGLKA